MRFAAFRSRQAPSWNPWSPSGRRKLLWLSQTDLEWLRTQYATCNPARWWTAVILFAFIGLPAAWGGMATMLASVSLAAFAVAMVLALAAFGTLLWFAQERQHADYWAVQLQPLQQHSLLCEQSLDTLQTPAALEYRDAVLSQRELVVADAMVMRALQQEARRLDACAQMHGRTGVARPATA